MRPLLRPATAGKLLGEEPASAVLMAAFGPFCMLSERPLPSVSHVWHAGRAREVENDRARADEWGELYLLDDATFNTVKTHAAPEGFLLPDRALTFTRTGGPFVYGLEEVRRTLLDENGDPEGEPVTESLAVVRATSPAAQQTIDLFALNTPYFHAETRELRIPRRDFLSMTDHRLYERTEAWRRAERSAGLLRQALAAGREEALDLLLEQIRLTVNATGYWSVWATVLGGAPLEGARLKRALCMPEDRVAHNVVRLAKDMGPDAARVHLGYGPHNALPGTRTDWLD